MGFSCSPLWCNLYFVAYEIQFMMRLAKLGLYIHMSSFKFAYHYIDNLCMLNNPDILKLLQSSTPGMLLAHFGFTPCQLQKFRQKLDIMRDQWSEWGLVGNFLNVKIEITNFALGLYQSTKFDKCPLLPFPFQQYIQFKSNRPILQSYNIVLSHVIPILYMFNKADAGFQEIGIVLHTLQMNGLCRQCLTRLFYAFVQHKTSQGLDLKQQILLMYSTPTD